MKFLIVLVAVLGLSAAQTRTLSDDLNELGTIIPIAEMGALVQGYIDTDAEVQEILAYLQGPEWAAVVEQIAVNEKWMGLKQFLRDAGVDIDTALQNLHDLIQNAGPSSKQSRAAATMLEELMALIPTDQLIIYLNDKLTNSPDFIAFWERISSEETHMMVEEILAMPEIQDISARLLEMGIDINEYLSIIYLFLGWN